MALIKCPECGRDNVSEYAEACPNCGFPIADFAIERNDMENNQLTKQNVSPTINNNDMNRNIQSPQQIENVNYSEKNNNNYTNNNTPVVILVCCAVLAVFGFMYYSSTRCKYIGCNRKRMSSSDYCVNHYSKLESTTFGRSGYDTSNNDLYSSYKTENMTTGNEGALNKAKSYLRSSAFSYSGLIDQLKFTGFSESEAKYGADNCGADWYEQAELKAKAYLRSSAFSYSGLIDQLEYTGFTESEAKYGADNCGADWYEQAKSKAESYRKSVGLSGDRLVDQLEYTGFTSDQAKYGEKSTR